MKIVNLAVVALCLLLSSEVFAKRILFASQYSLIPESQAHEKFGQCYDWALNPESIKIMVWNLKKGQEAGLDVDLPYYGADRDLLILSEGYLSAKVKPIFDSFQSICWDMGVAFLYKKDNNYKTGTMIGSKVAPSWIKIKQTKDHEALINTPKALTSGKYPIAGSDKDLLVISVHGINAVLPAAFARHMEIARLQMEAHDGPIIFAGDFNTNMPAKVKFLKKMTSNMGMQSIEFKNDARMKVFGQTIDYIFIKGLHPKNSEVLGSLKSSDHKAMMAELALN
ncbi:MAG: endonuclease/exonuclease/phosphatase family protein [Bacteriovoracaceae bacterium]